MFPLKCRECGCDFEGRTQFTAYCGSTCRQRVYRRTEKGKAATLRNNAKVKRKDIKKVCIHCDAEFVTARKIQELCNVCSKDSGAYYSQKRYRKNNTKKIRARGALGKRTRRSKAFYFAESCAVDGCEKEGEAHHPDYDKPYEIVWLCREHHKQVHGLNIQFTVDEIRVDEKWKAAHLMNL